MPLLMLRGATRRQTFGRVVCALQESKPSGRSLGRQGQGT
ncbi:uncharacterized protein CTRU02_207079 [Colletotrichum truncatum]|uniref:Uncharacterized protein n=1 Tax=Colletotrichum truncatum TaxID=5467 RepID=A0ACC3YZG7_COLTU|nr:uncharacterized protein CTRU02_11058 [Colletotrichum truncatum]KAF6786187.1 hypothetical protein CTRU02_11058 [Colletotrichum truncatum]